MYNVDVFRENNTWLADIVDLPGAHTYSRTFSGLQNEIQDVIRLVLDLPDDAEYQPVHLVLRGVDERFVEAAEIGDRRQELEAEQQRLTVQTMLAVKKLTEAGYSVRDISGALRLSPGRVSQLTVRMQADAEVPRPAA